MKTKKNEHSSNRRKKIFFLNVNKSVNPAQTQGCMQHPIKKLRKQNEQK